MGEFDGIVHGQHGHIVVQSAHIESAMTNESFDASFDVPDFGVGLDVVVTEAYGESGHVPWIHTGINYIKSMRMGDEGIANILQTIMV